MNERILPSNLCVRRPKLGVRARAFSTPSTSSFTPCSQMFKSMCCSAEKSALGFYKIIAVEL